MSVYDLDYMCKSEKYLQEKFRSDITKVLFIEVVKIPSHMGLKMTQRAPMHVQHERDLGLIPSTSWSCVLHIGFSSEHH